MTRITNETADLIDSLSYYYDIIHEMEEKGFHVQGVQLLSKTVRITFQAKEIKASFWRQELKDVIEIEIEVAFDKVDDMTFPETRLTFTLPKRVEKDE